MERKKKPTLIGKVIGTKMQKTIKVKVLRLVKHPRYGKYIRRSTIIKAHDKDGKAKENDMVEVMLTRPLSKTKNWRLVRILPSGISKQKNALEQSNTLEQAENKS